MVRKSTNKAQRFVAVGLTRNEITLLVLTRDGTEDAGRVHHRRIPWRQDADDPGDETGKAELTVALTKLATEQKLQGVPLHVTLSSDFCVTRVISGENESVQQELHELIERSSVYLSLGAGQKVTAISEHAVDARRRHVWMSVANESVLKNIDNAFAAARLNVVRIEHSLASISRVVHATGDDSEAPVVVVDVADSGVDIGMSYRGQLLLDYRPSGNNARENVGVIVMRHTKRLQRYIDRLLRRRNEPIRRVCLCGETEEVEQIREQLDALNDAGQVSLRVLNPGAPDNGWLFEDEAIHDYTLTAETGVLLHLTGDHDDSSESKQAEYPNLLDSIRDQRPRPFVRRLLKVLWPVVATTAASLFVSVSAHLQQQEADGFEADLALIENEMSEVLELRQQTVGVRNRAEQFRQIEMQLKRPEWHTWIQVVGQCMPRGVWLDGFRVERSGEITIAGTSRREDSLFEFINYLRQSPHLHSVALETTQETMLQSGRAVHFSVRASSERPRQAAVTMSVLARNRAGGRPLHNEATSERMAQQQSVQRPETSVR